MKAIACVYDEKQGRSLFKEMTVEKLPLGPYDLRVQVKALSVNPVDYKQARTIDAKNPGPRVLGWDAAGTVVEIGERVKTFFPGMDVFYAGAVNRPGTNSEFHVVDERLVGRMPKNLSYQEAAALPLTTITAYECLFEKVRLDRQVEKKILVIGGAGGVGSMALQLIKQLTRSQVAATAVRPESVAWVREMGANEVISYKEDFKTQLEQKGWPGVDVILCFNDTAMHYDNMARAINPFGEICSIVDMNTAVDSNPLKAKSVTFHWESMFTRSLYQLPDMIEQHRLLNEVADLVEAGKIRSTKTTELGVLNAENLSEAHRLLQTNTMIGKITLKGIT
ncbi:zinc-binding alcohol dehydrogenase family protein [Bdellovibrio bacteriovorus]|uniref:zinc-binding alcohol dehydrogenase family protein n=1 Tax=Bdellovibrio bacteriovorus TaxID=959 RepID=UPI0035A6B425